MGNLQVLLTTRCCNIYEDENDFMPPLVEQLPSNIIRDSNLETIESFVTVDISRN